jgi:hypothetical protein
VDCWVYLAGPLLSEPERTVVAAGDWVAHCAEIADYRQHWEGIADTGGRANEPPN